MENLPIQNKINDPEIALPIPETQEGKRTLAREYHEARAAGKKMPEVTVRHIGQEAWVAANRSAPENQQSGL